MQRSRTSLGTILLLAAVAGCHTSEGPVNEPIVVVVSEPLPREVTDHADFTGRTQAIPSVDIRARVSGYLVNVAFEAGAEVKEGQLLFEIDPAPYKAALEKAQAAVERSKAALKRQEADFARSERLLGTSAISREDYDKSAASRGEAVATVDLDKANLELARLDLGWTKVTAPFAGQTSRNLIDAGNLVEKDKTLLTTLVSLAPIYAYFDVDDQTMLSFKKLVREGKLKSYEAAKLKVLLGLPDEDGYPHEGVIDFVDNKVTPGTGTISVRGKFPNKDRAIAAGLFVRIRVPIGEPHKAILVSETALGSDQGQKYLLIVNTKNVVERRNVKVGSLSNGLREILDGITLTDRVITDGILRVRPGIQVQPRPGPMPLLPGADEEENIPKPKKKQESE
jgi:RND family efflux transporter MFP subunit